MKDLVFVLGAGASTHFGYPLGSELHRAMISFMTALTKNNSLDKSDLDVINARKFLEKIRLYNPLNIDYFLYNHPDDEPIGRRLLASTIIHSEHKGVFCYNRKAVKWWCGNIIRPPFSPGSSTTPEAEFFPASNWVKFIHHRVVANSSDSKDVIKQLKMIKVITFNYDLSFEHAISYYFYGTRFDSPELREFLTKEYFIKNVIHVYGSVRECKPKDESKGEFDCEEFNIREQNVQNLFFKCDGGGLKTIGCYKSKENEAAVNMLSNAEYTYFLGYGFDAFNNKVLGLDHVLKGNPCLKAIYYTNLDNGAIIDSRIRSFFNGMHFESFGADTRITQAYTLLSSGLPDRTAFVNIIKSNKYVYSALEHDLPIPLN